MASSPVRRPGVAAACAGGSCRPVVLAVAALCSLGAQAQVAGGRGLYVSSFVTLEETLTEVRGRRAGDNGFELVSRVAPGVNVTSRTGRVQGSLSYSAGLLYRHGGPSNQARTELQNALSAGFVAEAVPERAYVDVRASISQQLISAFGERTATTDRASDNRTEVRTLAVSPYVRGQLGGEVDYTLRLAASGTESSRDDAADSATATASLVLGSPARASRLGWTVAASDQRTKFRGVRSSRNDRVNAALRYQVDVDLLVSLTAGTEGADVGSIERRRYENYGGGLRWTPSPRTSVALNAEERYFGRSHQVALDHRAARSVWRYADSRGVADGGDGAAGEPVTLYNLLFTLYASQIPDPVAREAFVRALIAANGGDPNQRVASAVINRGATVTRRQELGHVWQGVRLSVNVSAFRSNARRLGDAAPATTGDNSTQSGYGGGVSYRLSPTSGLSFAGSRQMTKSNGPQEGTDLKSASVGYSATLGPRLTGAVNARYSVNNNPSAPSRETAVTGALSLRF